MQRSGLRVKARLSRTVQQGLSGEDIDTFHAYSISNALLTKQFQPAFGLSVTNNFDLRSHNRSFHKNSVSVVQPEDRTLLKGLKAN